MDAQLELEVPTDVAARDVPAFAGPTKRRLPLLRQVLAEQRELTAVERFSSLHDAGVGHLHEPLYRALLPTSKPRAGQQYAFEVNLDLCTGCKACVTACHRLNGLDEGETWRSVGLLHGKGQGRATQQTVTSACHHCADPACMKGCPVKAYEKDPVTGVVKHLDDQCIGCQYCVFTCPYEVPQFNADKGIVRKCDMCTDRLAVGEAPACVQACPSQAIAIRVIDVADAQRAAEAGEFLPGTPSPAITVPTTRYVSAAPLPAALTPADLRNVRPFDAHNPLVLMLVLTQLAAGSYAASAAAGVWLSPEVARPVLALQALIAIGLVGLGLFASTLHLGRPQYAFRALLGLRTSWMSREVLAFGAMAGLGGAYALLQYAPRVPWLGKSLVALAPLVAPLGVLLVPVSLLAVFTSVMIYAVTRRAYWSFGTTAAKFFGSALVLGVATTLAAAGLSAASAAPGARDELLTLVRGLALLIPPLLVAKLAVERRVLRHRHAEPLGDLGRSALLLEGALRPLVRVRLVLGVIGGLVLPALLCGAGPSVAAALGCALVITLVGGELCERALFFRAMASMRMPGGVA